METAGQRKQERLAGRGVTVVDCGHGNLASVVNALRALAVEARITTDPEDVVTADAIIFPGQGAAPAAMASLRRLGLDQALSAARARRVPMLGICLGMQLLLERSEEGATPGLGFLPGAVTLFTSAPERKVPQIGWNTVRHSDDPLFAGIPSVAYFYFVHSYYCAPADASPIGWTDYGHEYCSALHDDRVWATQFHPEKSGEAGLRLLRNFLTLARC